VADWGKKSIQNYKMHICQLKQAKTGNVSAGRGDRGEGQTSVPDFKRRHEQLLLLCTIFPLFYLD